VNSAVIVIRLKKDLYDSQHKMTKEVKKQNMKQTSRLTGIIAIALILAITFSGVALAAQTSLAVTVNQGSVRMESSLRSTSNEDIPYDDMQYDYNAIAVHASGVQMTHDADFEVGYVEVENSILYFPASGLKMVFVDENIQRAKIAEGADNVSLCYHASGSSRVNAKMLQYNSASIVTDSDLVFGVNSLGTGRIAVQTAEMLQQGNASGSWISSASRDSVSVRGGNFNLSAEFNSIIPESPPMGEEIKNILCPFYKP
jgi:hypothetical protein